ncbi:hypothetical protein MRB53_015359 [Persea americana]|uniref:Uncharacterized protein n=1 Tax=Persea americana TaxID=3435 RepID=A0ACC2KDM9_PERAE|nr:hypothetical protein MRB53_015359 [Persea americana]
MPSVLAICGRRDGLLSSSSDVKNLPGFTDSIDVQKKKYADKGLNTHDLVTLVGKYRLHNFTTTANGADPSINPAFLPQLQALCPANSDGSKHVALDTGSGGSFNVSYFTNFRNGRGVLESDQKLRTNASTRTYAQRYSGRVGSLQGLRFNVEFGRAMVKMGNIGVKTGSKWHSFVSTLAGLPDDCPLKRPRQLATGPCSRYGCPLKKCVINGCQSDTSNSTQATWT